MIHARECNVRRLGMFSFDCVLVFYCCVTDDHKFSNLRQHIFYCLTVFMS